MWTNDKHKSRGSYLLWQLCACLQFTQDKSLWASSLGHSGSGAEKGIKESLQLCLCNLNFTSNSPVAPRPLTEFSYFRQSVQSGNDCKCKQTLKKTYDVITNVISTSQQFASTFSTQIFKFQRCSWKLSFLYSPSAARAPWRACSQAR